MKNEKGQKRKYRRYDEAFKREIVNLLKQGWSVRDLSISLGVSEALLYRWKSQESGLVKKTSEEVKDLRKQNKRLKEENEVLKKALSIFSQSG